jgi:hypothetical protein
MVESAFIRTFKIRNCLSQSCCEPNGQVYIHGSAYLEFFNVPFLLFSFFFSTDEGVQQVPLAFYCA